MASLVVSESLQYLGKHKGRFHFCIAQPVPFRIFASLVGYLFRLLKVAAFEQKACRSVEADVFEPENVVCFRYFVGRLQNHLRPLSVCRGKKCVIERFCKPASVVFVGAGHFLEIGPKRFCGGGVARVVGYRENVDESLVCSVRIAVVEGMSES